MTPKRKKGHKTHPVYPWLPRPENQKPRSPMISGEPFHLRLRSFLSDKSMRTGAATVCCDCGLVHFETFEVFKDPKKPEWWLVCRSYRMDDISKDRRTLRPFQFVPRRRPLCPKKKS